MERVEYLGDGGRFGDRSAHGEPAATSNAHAKVDLEGSFQEGRPVESGARCVELDAEGPRLEDVQVYANDKATVVFRPYATAAQRAFTEDVRDRAARRLWNWSESEARRLVVAGGGSEGAFAAHYARGLASRDAIVRGLDDASYHGIIGGEFYLVAGRKPA